MEAIYFLFAVPLIFNKMTFSQTLSMVEVWDQLRGSEDYNVGSHFVSLKTGKAVTEIQSLFPPLFALEEDKEPVHLNTVIYSGFQVSQYM